MASFDLTAEVRVVTEKISPAKPKIFSFWFFTEIQSSIFTRYKNKLKIS